MSTHPIQYHTPWFRALAGHDYLDLHVFYGHLATPKEQSDAGFGVEFEWDVSLLNGYSHSFLKNVAAEPSVIKFSGVDNPEIARIIEQEKFDAVMVNGWHYKSAWQTMRACWKARIPVMARSDSHLLTKRSNLKRLLKRPYYRWFISKLDACLPVGKWSRDYFLHYGALPDRIFVVPHVVDTDYLQQQSERLKPHLAEIRQRWKLDPNAIVYLFAGKFVDKKRPLDFARAIGKASATGAKISGLMVGDGPLRQSCESFVKTNNVPVTFSGFLNQTEMADSYVAADALVLPSDGGETWGLVVNEAMACGRPCFVSDHVGCGPDLIRPGETGEIFPVGDTHALAAFLSSFSKERLESMGRKAAANGSSVDSAVDGIVQAVHRVTNGKDKLRA